MAVQHLMVQLYVEYLDRGGKPLRVYHEKKRRSWDDDDLEEEFEDE